MCGICGIINLAGQPVAKSDIIKMMSVIIHRGPDDEGIFIDNDIGLGHRRLSILDLSSAGHQPMFDQSGRYCVIHNGEIYNYIELKEELINKFQFITRTDTEVILYAYQEWGIGCLDRFNGMFAFAIYDTKERTLLIARDRFGIKPMYYYQSRDKFVFASEIKSILSVLPDENKLNDTVVFDYLVYNRTDQYPQSFFRNIKRLDHGHYVIIRNKNISFRRWYKLSERINNPFKSPEEFKDVLVDAIRLRLRSDVPVGVCLSGGLDSSSITSILTKILHKNDLQTFSAVYGEGMEGDESQYVNLYQDMVSKMHKAVPTGESLYSDIESFITCLGEPVPSTGPYAQFKVMELAKGNVTVLLDGQGGDELLAGYHYFFGNYLRELLLHWNLLRFLEESYFYYQKHHSLYAFQSLIFYLFPNSFKSKAKLAGRNYLENEFYEKEKNNSQLSETLFDAYSLRDALLNHFEYKLEHLLRWEDRNSMCFSLESRVPFLDHRLVERTLSLPSCKVIRQGMTKSILRDAMQDVVPKQIYLRQDKIGFMTPENEWFRTPIFQKFILELLDSTSFRQRPYFNHKMCKILYNHHLRRKLNISRDIWKWINLELWLRSME